MQVVKLSKFLCWNNDFQKLKVPYEFGRQLFYGYHYFPVLTSTLKNIVNNFFQDNVILNLT